MLQQSHLLRFVHSFLLAYVITTLWLLVFFSCNIMLPKEDIALEIILFLDI